MAYIEIAPAYRDVMHLHGLVSARNFLDRAGVIFSGHPRRHVLRVEVGGTTFVLKKEHSVSLRERLASTWAGFGWSSKSVREARVLQRLREAGVPCPQVVAAGEDGTQAFLMLREEAGMTELRDYLAGPRTDAERRALARALGRQVARIHAAGYEQPDLYAKHVLVGPRPGGFRFCFLDWQRSRWRPAVAWRRRLYDLAALDASLAEALASDALRLACLGAYLRTAAAYGAPASMPRLKLAAAIRHASLRLLQRRRTRELRQPPLPGGAQQLLWLERDERLCVAQDFHAELGGRLPTWLPRHPVPSADRTCLEHRLILLGSGRTAHLVQRWQRTPAGWLRRGKFPAPEFAQAATIYRLQRFGVAGPRLLAMGHQRVAGQRFSFLLTEPPAGPSLATVLRQRDNAGVRQVLLRALGGLMRQTHDAGYALRSEADPFEAWVVPTDEAPTAPPRLALASVAPLERNTGGWERLAAAAILRCESAKPQAVALSRTDRLRVLLGYLRLGRLDADARRRLRGLGLLRGGERQVA